MITVHYTTYGPTGSVRCQQSITDASFMDVRTGDKGEPILYVFDGEAEDELLAVFRQWDFAIRDDDPEFDDDDPAAVDEPQADQFNVYNITRGPQGQGEFRLGGGVISA